MLGQASLLVWISRPAASVNSSSGIRDGEQIAADYANYADSIRVIRVIRWLFYSPSPIPLKFDTRNLGLTRRPRVAWFKDPDGNLLSVSQH